MMMSKMAIVLALVGSVVGKTDEDCMVFASLTQEVDRKTGKATTITDLCKADCAGGAEKDDSYLPALVCKNKCQKCYIDCNGHAPVGLDKCDVLTGEDSTQGQGNQINPNPSAPSSSTRSTRIQEDMIGFDDMWDSGFYNFPPTMLGRYAQVPSVRTKAGYEMHMGCSAGQGGAGGYCDHFVVIYQCKPCEHADGGNIQAILLSKGFKPFRCGTYMDLDVFVESHHHNLIVFHKQTLQGNRDIIKAPELMEFTFFAFSPATTHCGAFTAEDLCWNSSPGECSWNNGECERDLCPTPHKPHGPWKVQDKCRVCPHDPSEERFIPANSMAR